MNNGMIWNQWVSNVMTEGLVSWDEGTTSCLAPESSALPLQAPESFPKAQKVLTYPQHLEELREPPRALAEDVTILEFIGCEESESLLDEIEEITETIEIPREARMIELPMHFWGALKGAQSYRQFKGYSVHDIALHFLGKAIFGDRHDND